MTEFSLELARSIVEEDKPFPVDFNKAWQWLEFSRKDSGKRSFESADFAEGLDFIVFHSIVEDSSKFGGLRKVEEIFLSIDCFKAWAMMVSTDKGKEVRKYFLECEKELNKLKTTKVLTGSNEAMERAALAIDLVFTQVNIEPALVAGIKLNTMQAIAPEIASYIEPARQLLINSTAKQERLITVTELGKLLNPPLSAIKTNQRLIAKGLQSKNLNKKSKKDPSYIATALGKEYSELTLVTVQSKSDTAQQLRWYDSVVARL